MQRFIYKAKSKDGKSREGKIESRDTTTAVGILRERGLVVIDIKAVSENGGLPGALATFGGVKLDDTVAFTRQMATMMSSGLPLTEALSVLELQSKPAMAKVIGDVLRDVQAGNTVADALAKHENVFSGVYVSLIRAGEAAGALDDVLKRLARNLEKEKDFKAKTKGALIYPAIVIVAMFGVTIIMMVFVVPKLALMYEDFDAELPLPTRILIGVSNLFLALWPVFLAAAVAGYAGFVRGMKTKSGRRVWDEFMLKVPVLGKLRTQILLAETSRTLSLLIGSGISLVESLDIVSGVVRNQVYKTALTRSTTSVKKGVLFSVSIARQGVFPPLLSNMLAVGEQTGKMDELLMKVSMYFEEEAENTIRNLTTALEPLIMVVLGIGVGFLVISIIMPIYNLTNQF